MSGMSFRESLLSELNPGMSPLRPGVACGELYILYDTVP